MEWHCKKDGGIIGVGTVITHCHTCLYDNIYNGGHVVVTVGITVVGRLKPSTLRWN